MPDDVVFPFFVAFQLFSFVRSKFSKVYRSTYIYVYESFWIVQNTTMLLVDNQNA